MENAFIGKHNRSFGKNLRSPSTIDAPEHVAAFSRKCSRVRNGADDADGGLWIHSDQLCADVERFTDALLVAEEKSSPPEAPDFVDEFSTMIESKIDNYNSDETRSDLGYSGFIEAVRKLSRLTNALSEFPSYASKSPSLNRTSMVLQRAMAFLEEEFRSLLEDSMLSDAGSQGKLTSVDSKNRDDWSDRCVLRRENDDSGGSDDFAAYPPEAVVTKMSMIAVTMVAAGYETECCQVYSISRRNAIKNQMNRLEFEKINIDDVVRMPWESLEGEISRWIKVVKACSETIFPGEKKLGEAVFPDHPQICRSLYSNFVRAVVIQLLDFAEAVAMAKRSAEKLFKFLDMYETLKNLILSMDLDSCSSDLTAEIISGGDRVGEAAAGIFCDLENSIKGDSARTPVPGGAVHPLTRYVMNYLKYASEYKDTLEKIFEKHMELESKKSHGPQFSRNNSRESNRETLPAASSSPCDGGETTPFSAQVVRMMDLLDANLEVKSSLYRDPSLRHIFLMNNGRYILQKVKGSTEIRAVMGDTWCRRRSTVVRQYHKNYQRETWSKVLQCLNQEGLQISAGKVNKTLLKERFKIFSTTFEEIHRTQSTWMVSDEQLQSELRVSISAVVIPAYRSFVGRFRQYLDSGKQADKYIKYQPEDIETMIEDLFEGNTSSMSSRRKS